MRRNAKARLSSGAILEHSFLPIEPGGFNLPQEIAEASDFDCFEISDWRGNLLLHRAGHVRLAESLEFVSQLVGIGRETFVLALFHGQELAVSQSQAQPERQ